MLACYVQGLRFDPQPWKELGNESRKMVSGQIKSLGRTVCFEEQSCVSKAFLHK